ncbi:hypothetical protein ANN_18630 [Periplaneta americana]|uniref:Histone-lysine N-methyltransferase SETMAR n=1 Tax=Periplaneta americana TaxID=6978 RepID=A0ABQ8SQJ9_PERAM|nr:hypothetical protein ANN_18630 [Periplaneta americana]
MNRQHQFSMVSEAQIGGLWYEIVGAVDGTKLRMVGGAGGLLDSSCETYDPKSLLEIVETVLILWKMGLVSQQETWSSLLLAAHRFDLADHKICGRQRRGMLSHGIVLLHDNARPYTAAATRDLLEQFLWELFDHLLYSPDLASSDFHLFTKLKEFLSGKCFGSDDELKNVVNNWLKGLAADDYNMGILKLVDRYENV